MKINLTADDLARMTPQQRAFLEALEWETSHRPEPEDTRFRGLPLRITKRHNAEEEKARAQEIRHGDGISIPDLFRLPERRDT